MLQRITELVNETISCKKVMPLNDDIILAAIDRGKSEGGPQGRHWVPDPIDGTKGLLRREQYAITLALLDQGPVVLGVLGCPNQPFSGLSPTGRNTNNAFLHWMAPHNQNRCMPAILKTPPWPPSVNSTSLLIHCRT